MLSLRDPVHGYVKADELEARLVQCRALQRLRWVRQLGLTHLVFHGAEHSRFSHVLGAMELAGRVYDALAERAPDLLESDPRAPARRAVRLAALLHDIGHAPFSHSAEELFEEGLSHEDMTIRLIRDSEVADTLATYGNGVDADLICSILDGSGSGTGPLLSQVVSGELDVDKMDYLLRDSLFCGVRYGNYDLGRLLETMIALRDPATGRWGIGIDEGGVHAFEALVLARYYMFTQVYFNLTGKVLELHLNEWLRDDGLRWSANPGEFVDHDDVTAWSAMRASGSRHARAIIERRHHTLAFETGEHLTAGERQDFTALLAEIQADFESGDLLVSHSAKDTHRLGATNLLVRDRDGGLMPLQDVSNFVGDLSRIDRFRIYTRADLAGEVGALFKEQWQT